MKFHPNLFARSQIQDGHRSHVFRFTEITTLRALFTHVSMGKWFAGNFLEPLEAALYRLAFQRESLVRPGDHQNKGELQKKPGPTNREAVRDVTLMKHSVFVLFFLLSNI